MTLLPIDNPHAVAIGVGIANNPITVTDSVIELDFVAILTILSNDFIDIVYIIYSSDFFFDL